MSIITAIKAIGSANIQNAPNRRDQSRTWSSLRISANHTALLTCHGERSDGLGDLLGPSMMILLSVVTFNIGPIPAQGH